MSHGDITIPRVRNGRKSGLRHEPNIFSFQGRCQRLLNFMIRNITQFYFHDVEAINGFGRLCQADVSPGSTGSFDNKIIERMDDPDHVSWNVAEFSFLYW